MEEKKTVGDKVKEVGAVIVKIAIMIGGAKLINDYLSNNSDFKGTFHKAAKGVLSGVAILIGIVLVCKLLIEGYKALVKLWNTPVGHNITPAQQPEKLLTVKPEQATPFQAVPLYAPAKPAAFNMAQVG